MISSITDRHSIVVYADGIEPHGPRNLGRGKGRVRGLVVETVIKMNEKQ
jgi:hypothetical protein